MRVNDFEEVLKLITRFDEIEVFPTNMARHRGLDYLMDVEIKITLGGAETLVTQKSKRWSPTGRAYYATLLESFNVEKEEIRTKLKELGVNMEDRINPREEKQ